MVCKFLYRNKLLLLVKIYFTVYDWSRKKAFNYVFLDTQGTQDNSLCSTTFTWWSANIHGLQCSVTDITEFVMLSPFGGKQLHY